MARERWINPDKPDLYQKFEINSNEIDTELSLEIQV